MFSEELSSNNNKTEALSKYHYPYMMQYQFVGSSKNGCKSVPSFSSDKPMPADIRFLSHQYSVGSWGLIPAIEYLLQIRSPWDSSLLTKRNFNNRENFYSSIQFDFTYTQATTPNVMSSNISVSSFPPSLGFSIRLISDNAILRIGSPGYWFKFQKTESVAFLFNRRHLLGNLPPHIYHYFDCYSHWES